MKLDDEQLEHTALLLALDYDGDLIGLATADTVSRTDLVTWLRRVANELECDLYNRY